MKRIVSMTLSLADTPNLVIKRKIETDSIKPHVTYMRLKAKAGLLGNSFKIEPKNRLKSGG
jgi:hypothetical protein